MALEECPACQKAISVKARSCPNCGEPLKVNWAKTVARQRQGDRPTKFQSLLVAVVLGTLVPGSILYGFSYFSTDEASERPTTQMAIPPRELSPEEKQAKAMKAAREREKAAKQKAEERARVEQQERKAYLDRVRREINSFGTFDVRKFTGTNFGFLAVNTAFQVWASMVEEAKRLSLGPEGKALVEQFREGVIEVQKRALPEIRDAYGPHMRKLLWEKNLTAKTLGDGFRTIEFVGGVFAANRNIKAFNDELWETFRILRFKQVRYKWFKEVTEYTYFDIDGPDDGDLVVWGDGTFRKIK